MGEIKITPEELEQYRYECMAIFEKFQSLAKECDQAVKINYYEAGAAKVASDTLKASLAKYYMIADHYRRIGDVMIQTKAEMVEADEAAAQLMGMFQDKMR